MKLFSKRDIARELRWTCPHCKRAPMRLHSALKHMRLRHLQCWSCEVETLLVRRIMAGNVEGQYLTAAFQQID